MAALGYQGESLTKLVVSRKKCSAPCTVLATVALAAVLTLTTACSIANGGEGIAASSSVTSLGALPETIIPPVLLGKPIESHGLALELPAAHGVTDPNFASSGQLPFGAGSSKEYTSLTLSFPESANTGVTCWVARLQAFGLDGNAPQQCTYRIDRLHDSPKSYLHEEVDYTYTQIEPFILYSSPQVVVLGIATLGNYADEREMLSQHILQNEGKELGRPAFDDSSPRVFADGTTIYKYDWLLPAFDYLTASYRVALAQEKGVMLQFAP